jgi:glycosyltransferase 2 family protein
MIPVSFAGWGLREIGFVTVAGSIGVPSETAILISIVFGILLTASALPGLIIWLKKDKDPATKDLVHGISRK